MKLFIVERPEGPHQVVSAASMRVVDGCLLGMKWDGIDIEVAFSPGEWSSFRAAEECPTCKRQLTP